MASRRSAGAVLVLSLGAGWLLAAAHLGFWAKTHPGQELIHGHDDRHYFSTAHSLVFDGDLDFANEYARLAPESLGELTPAGRTANKYGVGMPLLAIPAVIFARIVGFGGNDGLGRSAQAAFALWNAALGLAGTGLVALAAGRATRPGPAVGATLLLFLGSSASWYVLVQPAMAHAAALFCHGTLLVAWERRYLAGKDSPGWAALLGGAAGFAAAVRMQDAPLALLCVGSEIVRWGTGRPAARDAVRDTLFFAAAFLTGIFPQLLYQRLVWGGWLVDAYSAGGERFFWTKPQIFGLLFSTRNSLFFYAPLSLFGIAGILARAGHGPRRAYHCALIAMVALNIYVNACWHLWTMGASFGARGLLGCWPFFTLGLAAVLDAAASWRRGSRIALWTLLLSFLAWALLMFLLYHTEAIPHDGSGFDLGSLGGRIAEAARRFAGKVRSL